MAEEYEEEYYDNDEGEDYNEEEEHDAEYDYNEDGGEDGDIQVGEEIDLTHEEVWDDSALIEAWDMAVKQYEVYHSQANPKVNQKDNSKEKIINISLTPSSSNKHKHTDIAPQSSTSSTKRTKLNPTNGTSTTSQLTISEPDSSPTSTAAQAQQPPLQGADSHYDVLERKPSFKKADKPSFNHHKERREEFEKEKARKAKASSSTATTAASSSTSAAPAPMVDAATIAYYQQLGYYYDPSYAAAHRTEAALQGEEHKQGGDEDEDQSQSQEQKDRRRHRQEHGHNGSGNEVEAAGNSKVSGSAHTSHSSGATSSKTKPTSKSTTSRAAHKNRAAYPIPNLYVPGPTMHPSQSPLYPSPHGFYTGYHPGYLPPAPPSHIPPGVPTAAAVGPSGGGFGFPEPPAMPGMPGMALPGWNGPGGSTPSGHGAFAAAGRGMMPPPPPFPSHSAGGAFSGPKMDDEALGNLIMAWYFSGYYTGLYQAQRR